MAVEAAGGGHTKYFVNFQALPPFFFCDILHIKS
jgi:hypothetical protein